MPTSKPAVVPTLEPEDVSPHSPLLLSAAALFVVGSPNGDGRLRIHSQHRSERTAQAIRRRDHRGKPEVRVCRVERG